MDFNFERFKYKLHGRRISTCHRPGLLASAIVASCFYVTSIHRPIYFEIREMNMKLRVSHSVDQHFHISMWDTKCHLKFNLKRSDTNTPLKTETAYVLKFVFIWLDICWRFQSSGIWRSVCVYMQQSFERACYLHIQGNPKINLH